MGGRHTWWKRVYITAYLPKVLHVGSSRSRIIDSRYSSRVVDARDRGTGCRWGSTAGCSVGKNGVWTGEAHLAAGRLKSAASECYVNSWGDFSLPHDLLLTVIED